MNISADFRLYAKDKFGVTDYDLQIWDGIQEQIYHPRVLTQSHGTSASLTPYILEERELRVTQNYFY